jgi:glycosyltransferase involved in cell wall biosynthesis
VDGGVDKDKIKIIPEAVDVEFFDPKTVDPYEFPSTLGIKEDTIVYLSIFKWEERKAWRILLKAYFQAFQPEENVILVILTNAYHVEQQTAADFRRLVQEFATKEFNKLLKALPKVYILPPNLPQDEMPSLYKAATAFVLPSRGEGWGRPHVEAMAMELPIIATFWSGTTEYMTESNSYPLRIDGLVEIEEGAFKGHKWAEPSVQHLKELLLHVKYNPKVKNTV